MFRLIVVFTIGLLIGSFVTTSETVVEELNGTAWCYSITHPSMANYETYPKPPDAFIVFRGKEVRVYIPCVVE